MQMQRNDEEVHCIGLKSNSLVCTCTQRSSQIFSLPFPTTFRFNAPLVPFGAKKWYGAVSLHRRVLHSFAHTPPHLPERLCTEGNQRCIRGLNSFLHYVHSGGTLQSSHWGLIRCNAPHYASLRTRCKVVKSSLWVASKMHVQVHPSEAV